MQDYMNNTIKYKSIMAYNGNAKPVVYDETFSDNNPLLSNENVNTFLEKDIQNLKRETWSRLDKATKLQKLRHYMEKEVKEDNMTQIEADILYSYFKSCLDKKKSPNTRTVEYNIQTGKVISIKEGTPGKTKKKPLNSSATGSISGDVRKKTKKNLEVTNTIQPFKNKYKTTEVEAGKMEGETEEKTEKNTEVEAEGTTEMEKL